MPKMIARQKITETEQTVEMDIQIDPNSDNSDWRPIYAQKKHFFNNGDFATIFQGALREISGSDMSKDEFRIFIALMGNMDFENKIETKISIIAKTLKMNKGNVSKAITKLVERNIIIKQRGEGNFEFQIMFERINQNIAHKGKIKEYKRGQDPKILTTQKQIEEEKYKQLEFDNFDKK